MSVRLILTQYLGAMKERDELDLLLPDLLAAMGHTVLSRPQRGTRQGGVDCLSERAESDGIHAYLFILKQGDVDRAEFFASPQGIAASVTEASVDYIRTRLPSHLQSRPKHLVLVSSGRMREQVSQNFASLTKEVAERSHCDLTFWGDARLAELVEENLFNETLVLGEGRSHLRRSIATIDRSDIATRHMGAFFSGVMQAHGGGPSAWKGFAKHVTTAVVGWLVLRSWCTIEGNLKPAVASGEYLLLLLWSSAKSRSLQADAGFLEKHDELLRLYADLLVEYYNKSLPQLSHPRALLRYRPERAAYSALISEELGRLACFILMFGESDLEVRRESTKKLAQLFEAHEGCLSPYFDGQAIDLSIALAAFMREGASQPIRALTRSCAVRLHEALRRNRNLPIDTDSLDDALAYELGELDDPREYFRVSTFVPMLATVAAETSDEELLGDLRTKVVGSMAGVNLERWFPHSAIESAWGTETPRESSLGVSRSVEIAATCELERESAKWIPDGASPPSDFSTMNDRSWLLALSSRVFRHPLPPWFFSEVNSRRANPVIG